METTYKRKPLHIDYIQEMVNYYCQTHPTVDRTKVIKAVADKVMTDIKTNPLKVEIDGEETPILDVDTTIVKEGIIVTGKGNLYKNQHAARNLAAAMILFLLDQRGVQKDKMFKAMREYQDDLAKRYNFGQITYKILNNAFFGASIEPNSIFYNPYSGDSIMSSGRDIITVSVNIFEKWFSNNIYFRDVTDCITYVRDIAADYATDFENHGIKFQTYKSVPSVVDYLLSKTDEYTESEKEKLRAYLTTFANPELINLVFYKNNILEFFRDSNILEYRLKEVLGHNDFLDPNKVPADIKPTMDNLWTIIKTYVFHNHQDYYRYKNMERKRKTVLTIDTDSNFLYLNPVLEELAKLAPDKVDPDDKTSIVVNINVIMYFATKVINETYTRYGIEIGIPADYTGRINMKNEFLLETLMVTEGKKHYASIVLMQEGNIFKEPKIDIKGLAIKKSNTNPNVRSMFTSILEDEILKPKEVNVSKIINKYRTFEEEIKTSLERGETTYALRGSVNSPLSYDRPLSIKAVRGVLLWNKLFPSEEITFPAKVNMVNLLITPDILEASPLTEEEKAPLRQILNNPSMTVGNEITVLALPREKTQVPKQFLPFIDSVTTVAANLSPGMPILNSAGGTILSSQGGLALSSNIVKM